MIYSIKIKSIKDLKSIIKILIEKGEKIHPLVLIRAKNQNLGNMNSLTNKDGVSWISSEEKGLISIKQFKKSKYEKK